MASKDAEQREIPWEFYYWRRFLAIVLALWLVSAISVITIVIYLYQVFSDALVTGLSTAFTVMS